jgi:hypothetical protein
VYGYEAGNECVLHTYQWVLLRDGRQYQSECVADRCVHLQLVYGSLERLEQQLFGERDSDSDRDLHTLGWHYGRRYNLYSDQTCNQSDGE